MYRFYKGSTLNTTASGTNTGTAGMTGLTTGATNACTVRAIDRAGNEGEPYAINVPTKLYKWDVFEINYLSVIDVRSTGEEVLVSDVYGASSGYSGYKYDGTKGRRKRWIRKPIRLKELCDYYAGWGLSY